MRKKIAFVTPSLLPMPPVKGGAMETLVDHLLLCNEKTHDFDITVYCVEDEEAKEAAAHYRFTRFCGLPGRAPLPRLDDLFIRGCRKAFGLEISPERFYSKRVAKALAREPFDAIIVENQPEFLSGIRKAAPQTPVWLHLHNHPSNFSEKGRLALQSGSGVLAVSDFIREEVRKAASLRPEQAVTLPNCVDTARFDSARYPEERAKIRQNLGIAGDDVVLMYSGRLTEAKGVGRLLEAFLQVSNLALKLMLVGSDWYGSNAGTPFVERLRCLAEKAPGRVFLTGFIPFSHMPEYYAAADICTLPSLLEEASPLTVLEAQAAGKPLIATDAGGIPENASEDCAILVRRDGEMVSAMAAAIQKLAEDPDLRRRMGKAGRQRTEARGIGPYYQHFSKILTEICGR